MPLLLVPLILAAVFFITPMAFLSAPAVQLPAPAAATAPTMQVHYTKAAIVQINTMTGATRFTQYKLVPQLERRTNIAA